MLRYLQGDDKMKLHNKLLVSGFMLLSLFGLSSVASVHIARADSETVSGTNGNTQTLNVDSNSNNTAESSQNNDTTSDENSDNSTAETNSDNTTTDTNYNEGKYSVQFSISPDGTPTPGDNSQNSQQNNRTDSTYGQSLLSSGLVVAHGNVHRINSQKVRINGSAVSTFSQTVRLSISFYIDGKLSLTKNLTLKPRAKKLFSNKVGRVIPETGVSHSLTGGGILSSGTRVAYTPLAGSRFY
mgnify:CR=1 FL=1